MKTATFEYRCLRCNNVMDGEETAEETAQAAILRLAATQGQPFHTAHKCPDGGYGIARCIGYRVHSSQGKVL